mgnify:CR=1 FL=1
MENRPDRDRLLLWAQIADIKTNQYCSMLALVSLIDVLVAKGILTPDELSRATARQTAGLELRPHPTNRS